jgi:hypothetical protein
MLLELVILYLLVRGAAEAWKETRAAWGRSRNAYTASAGRRYPGMSPRRRAAHAARHDLGYGLSQLLHGFPQARHGFAQGWNEGRQAHVQARTAREQARTERAEAHAGALGTWRELRKRRNEALEEIRRSRRGEGSEGTTSPGAPDREGACIYCEAVDGENCAPWCPTVPRHADNEEEPEEAEPLDGRRLCWSCFARDGEEHALYCATRKPLFAGDTDGPTYSYGLEDADNHWPAANREQAERQAQAASRDGRTHVVLEYPPGGGRGQVVATYLNDELVPAERLGGEYGNEAQAIRDGFEYEDCEICGRGLDRHDIAPDSLGHAHAYCRDTEDEHTPDAYRSGSPTEGTTMSDVTYDGVVRRTASLVEVAENTAAEVNAAATAAEEQEQAAAAAKSWAGETADQMQALNVDAATLGAMADHLDAADAAVRAHQQVREALEEARKAHIRVMETAQNVSATLQQGHAGLNAAHQDAPVAAADREFYQD